MIEIINCNPNITFWLNSGISASNISNEICQLLGFCAEDFYLLANGKRLDKNDDNDTVNCSQVHVVQRTVGGKGGFGSMLRAIGAQIEKTTNREACRDLSGRRLRDINEEKRLKNWIDQQAEREQEAADKKQKKIQRLCQQPKHVFKDETYDKERSALPEKLEDALTQGLEASASTSGENKRKKNSDSDPKKKKKAKLWLDDEIDISSGSDDEESEDEIRNTAEITKLPAVELCKETTVLSNSKETEDEIENTADVSKQPEEQQCKETTVLSNSNDQNASESEGEKLNNASGT